MARSGKPDKTGRSSGKLSGKVGERQRPPAGASFIWLTQELMESDAWRGRSVHCVRLIDFLLLDHMANAGKENGRLMATYDQLVTFGITRKRIRDAIREAEQRGLVHVEHGGRWNMTNKPSAFRLTFYADHAGAPATNCWKRYRDPKNQNHAPKKGTTVVPTGGTTSVIAGDFAPDEIPEISQSEETPVVPTGGTASISSLVSGDAGPSSCTEIPSKQGASKIGAFADLRGGTKRGRLG